VTALRGCALFPAGARSSTRYQIRTQTGCPQPPAQYTASSPRSHPSTAGNSAPIAGTFLEPLLATSPDWFVSPSASRGLTARGHGLRYKGKRRRALCHSSAAVWLVVTPIIFTAMSITLPKTIKAVQVQPGNKVEVVTIPWASNKLVEDMSAEEVMVRIALPPRKSLLMSFILVQIRVRAVGLNPTDWKVWRHHLQIGNGHRRAATARTWSPRRPRHSRGM
jgi:hypothetical protein